MTIKEQLAEKKAALVELEPQLKSEDVSTETVEQGEALVKEIAELEEKCAKAEKAEALLKTIGTAEDNNDISEEKTMSQIEEFTKQAAEMKDRSVGVSMKAYNSVVTAPTIADVDRSIAPQPKRIAAEDFLSVATISGNAVTYFTQGAFETQSGIGTTAQNYKKPQASTSFTGTTLALSKIAAWIKETDEIINDAPFLASEVENSLVYQIGKASDNFIINAIGSTVGIGAETYDGTNKTFADGILASILKIKEKYDASVVYLNPADIYALLSAKDSNKQYYGGGYFSGAYGNGALGIPASIWGVPMFASSQVSEGAALVVAKEAVKVWKKGGIDVKLFEQNEDDALYNRVTLLGEVREACAVVDLAGVVLLDQSNS
jgi:HK97 family phage major capsid protein